MGLLGDNSRSLSQEEATIKKRQRERRILFGRKTHTHTSRGGGRFASSFRGGSEPKVDGGSEEEEEEEEEEEGGLGLCGRKKRVPLRLARVGMERDFSKKKSGGQKQHESISCTST